jgi:hypothetical protein
VNLRDRTRAPFDLKGLRKQWRSERKVHLIEEAEETVAV